MQNNMRLLKSVAKGMREIGIGVTLAKIADDAHGEYLELLAEMGRLRRENLELKKQLKTGEGVKTDG